MRGRTGPCTTLRARSCPPVGPPCTGPSNTRLWANKGEIQLKYNKVSQNGVVSPKYVHKACHSPYSQNGSRKSPLKILRFPFSPAFSHKELMAYFDASRVFLVKMTKCRQNVHAKGRSDTPTVNASKLATVDRSSSDLARGIQLTFSTGPLLTVLQGIMTETCI